MSTDTYRIGVATGFAGDRFEPALVLAEHGNLDALVFECLAERTIGLAQERMSVRGQPGFDALFLQRLRQVLPILPENTNILTNAGAADPRGLARAISGELQRAGVNRRVAAITGDDVLRDLPAETQVTGTELSVADFGDRVVSANAYIGAAPAKRALESGAEIIVTGRMGDAALFAAPISHHFGADAEDPAQIAAATLIGHLLECGGQLTGGYFADGDTKTVPGLATLGFPLAEVESSGVAMLTKVAGTGGLLDRRTVLEQLFYEIDNPAAYMTPDVTLDLREVEIAVVGEDLVRISGARAEGRPEKLKVSIGVRDGYLASGSIGYVGQGARRRAELALQIIEERWELVHRRDRGELSLTVEGVNSMRPWFETDAEPPEARARAALRTFDKAAARTLAQEVEALYTNGPAGGGGVLTSVKETTGIVSALIGRDLVEPRVEFVEC